ncbi:hypothetical protein KCU93_g6885, partial [Aureobasidium melanogenum]
MGKVGGFFDIVNIFCLASRLVDWQNPICAYDDEDALSIETNDPSQALKERLETMPDNLGIEIPVGPIGETEAKRIMSTAISAMKSQATIGPDAMSQDELNEFMARLEAPKLTTMLTVPVSTPTKRSAPEAVADLPGLSDEELKKHGFRREWYECPTLMPFPCLYGIFASPTRLPPSDEFLARLDAPKPTKRSESTSASDHSSEEELKKTADEGPERAGLFCLPFVMICL